MKSKKKRRRFKELRRELKGLEVSIDDLTKRCGLSSSMAYSIFNGEKIPSLKTLKSIVKRLKLPDVVIKSWFWDHCAASRENREIARLVRKLVLFP